MCLVIANHTLAKASFITFVSVLPRVSINLENLEFSWNLASLEKSGKLQGYSSVFRSQSGKVKAHFLKISEPYAGGHK